MTARAVKAHPRRPTGSTPGSKRIDVRERGARSAEGAGSREVCSAIMEKNIASRPGRCQSQRTGADRAISCQQRSKPVLKAPGLVLLTETDFKAEAPAADHRLKMHRLNALASDQMRIS